MKIITRIWDAITYPFVSLAVLIDESRRQNLDGSWDLYHAKKNCRAEYKRNKTEIKNKRRTKK